MPTLKLVEYHRDNNYIVLGNTFSFDPDPASIKKDVAVKWRIRRAGYEKKIERGRFRYNEKIAYTVKGSCTKDKRDEIEWFAKRDAIFKVVGCELKTYHSAQTDDSDAATPTTYAAAKTQGEETVFVVFESTNFTQNEAKKDWMDYQLVLRRVHQTRH